MIKIKQPTGIIFHVVAHGRLLQHSYQSTIYLFILFIHFVIKIHIGFTYLVIAFGNHGVGQTTVLAGQPKCMKLTHKSIDFFGATKHNGAGVDCNHGQLIF